MSEGARDWHYPADLPVVERRAEILQAIRENQVVVVVSETGSGKTTQLPKMVLEALGESGCGKLAGCTQPRRIAAASVAARVAEELREPLGGFVGYQVRFEDRTSAETQIKFMTDGILLAETQGDRRLSRYAALIIDEAHERSLNIDFLLGYLKRLLPRRPDLKLVISSATLDAGAFSEFFGSCPVVKAEGRSFPVEEVFLPGDEEEDLAEGVLRAVDWLTNLGEHGDVLVFLPGEREIRDCAEVLEGRGYRDTEVVPLYARLGLAEQQRVFHPGKRRRLVLATNVAETSLTIPRIACVVDPGLARVSRWSPGRGVQRLQVEEVSQASARQRKGRCGRVREGVCVRLYSEENLHERPEFTDPEIRRSSLAGVILRMMSLGLPEISEFPFLDPPAKKAVAEGYRTLREVGALDAEKRLTEDGRSMARMPVDPRFARMLLAAEAEGVLGEMIPVVAGLELQDPRLRPQGREKEADRSHSRWRHEESDFFSLLGLWQELQGMRKGRRWWGNKLRKFCGEHFLSYRRVVEWGNVAEELRGMADRSPGEAGGKLPDYAAFHRALLAGAPRQFGLWDREERAYRSASGGFFAVFPGSGLFGGKRHDWVMGMELVETSRLYARRLARIDPEWVEQVAPHLCRRRYSEGHWDIDQGAVYAKETVLCGGLPVVAGRKVHLGRIDPVAARKIFIVEGLMQGGVKGRSEIVERLRALRETVVAAEQKLRRSGGLWSEGAVVEFFENRLPQGMCTAREFLRWERREGEACLPLLEDVSWEDLEGLEGYPDSLGPRGGPGDEYAVYYFYGPGERDDGVTLGVHVDQLANFPGWLPGWGVDGDLERRAEALIRSLPKDFRRACQPVSTRARGFAEKWRGLPKSGAIEEELARFLREETGLRVEAEMFDRSRLPEELVTKIWVCDDAGKELGFGVDAAALQRLLGVAMRRRREARANADWERSGATGWPGDELPEEVESGGVSLFPALVDEGKTVGTRVFSGRAEAAESHRAGLARLMILTQPEQAAHLRKKPPLDWSTKLEWPRRGGDLEELVRLAAEGALGGKMPRDAGTFAAAAEQGRGEWWESARRVGKALEEVFALLPDILDRIQPMRGHRTLGEIAEDVDEELGWLLRREFLWRAGFPRAKEYDRPFRALAERLKRVESLPAQKDLEKMDRVREFWEPWHVAWMGSPDDARLWDYGWLLEEYRISLFAPGMKATRKVSEKILRAGWE